MIYVPALILQGIILFVILGKVQSLGLGRDPFAGLIFELSAFTVGRHDALFGAEDLLIFIAGAVSAILAGSGNIFPEQHDIDLVY